MNSIDFTFKMYIPTLKILEIEFDFFLEIAFLTVSISIVPKTHKKLVLNKKYVLYILNLYKIINICT